MGKENGNGHKKSMIVNNYGKNEKGEQVADPKPGFIDEGRDGRRGYFRPMATKEEIDAKLANQDDIAGSVKDVDGKRNTPGSVQFLPHMDTRLTLECSCKNTAFTVVVKPDPLTTGAKILSFYCLNPACHMLVVVSETGMVGENSSLRVDAEGKKHHKIQADTGQFFAKGK